MQMQPVSNATPSPSIKAAIPDREVKEAKFDNEYIDFVKKVAQGVQQWMEGSASSTQSFKRVVVQKKTGEVAKNMDEVWKRPPASIRRFQTLYQRHINEFLSKYLGSEIKSAVELGAGVVLEGQTSYLGQCLPSSIRQIMTYTDINPEVVIEAHSKGCKKYQQVDSTKLSKKFEKVELIVGSAFLDTLEGDKLHQTVREVYKTLMVGGIFFHISDIQPFLNTLVFDTRIDGEIQFPLCVEEGFAQGVQIVSRDKCEQFVKENLNSGLRAEAEFLQEYLKYSSVQRSGIVVQLFALKKSLALSQWVKRTFQKECFETLNDEFFTKKIETAFKGDKFELLQCGLATKEGIFARDATIDLENFNSFTGELGNYICKNEEDIKAGKVRRKFTVHILVAKKKAQK